MIDNGTSRSVAEQTVRQAWKKSCEDPCHKGILISVPAGETMEIECPRCGQIITIHGSRARL